ncbi:MAG: 3-deoxy-7-phosphoheptulonate synthase [Patescibacteria group bacterium]|jgi:3-deoxy-7-phosphoheptulonate synthase|nr:3-deoxy-7-phosphoheptulonate synthase [Patescibacteria group bacterium]
MSQSKILNVNIKRIEPIIAPRYIRKEFPVSKKNENFIVQSRDTIKDIMGLRDSRFMVVVGPCSIHDPESALEYAEKLKRLQKDVADKFFIVMRAYVEKPRTTVGWKGLVNDPDLDGTHDISKGLRLSRKLYRDITEMGVPIANEMLDPMTPQYLAEFVSWGAIGARTTEAQTHRELVSGLSFPVGFKNGTDGNINIATQAMEAAIRGHNFIGVNAEGLISEIETEGNKDVHMVLRGGRLLPNYSPAYIKEARELLWEKKFMNTGLMVDCSHGNCSGQFNLQVSVMDEGINQILSGIAMVKAWMIESHLNEGSQKINGDRSKLQYGVSITDPCINFETMATNLLKSADRLRHEKIDHFAHLDHLQTVAANF